MKVILTRKQEKILVSDSDFENLNQYSWSTHLGYACRNKKLDGKYVRIRMHRELLNLDYGAKDKRIVDHINRNKLDNRRENLRIATPSVNNANRGPTKANTSGYKGVRYIPHGKRRKRWLAEMRHNKKLVTIGIYLTAEEAHEAYCRKLKELRGFA